MIYVGSEVLQVADVDRLTGQLFNYGVRGHASNFPEA